jgi:putative transposase
VRGKNRRLFSSTSCPRKTGPKGPDQALIHAIVELKSRNPRFGSPRIARIIPQTFGIDVDKNVVYRVLGKHYRRAPGGSGPSWLSFIGHTTDSLWKVDLFRCESIVLRSYWVLVVMDQFTRRLVGIGVRGGTSRVPICAACSTPRFTSRAYRDISVRITIRCSRRTGGRRTCGF